MHPVFAQTAEIQWKETSLTFEESAGTVDITLVRSGNLTGLASVFYQTVAGTATSGFDYQSISNRQALFTTGKEEITISIRINQDFLEEGPETFLLQLFNPNTETIIGSNKDLTLTIQDDDVATIEWSEGVVRVGVNNALGDSFLELFSGGTKLADNDDWQSASNSITVSSLLAPGDAKDSTILITLVPGACTAILSGANGNTGIGLIEIYEVTE